MKIQAPRNPNRQQIEKIAKTIVIHVKENEDADPYDMIRGTGMSDNLQEVLLNKFNIHNFLHDFHGATGDPHSRDVGSPPLSLDKLFGGVDTGAHGCCTGGGSLGEEDGTKVTKIEGPGIRGVVVRKKITVPLSQAKDMHDMSKGSIVPKEDAAPPKEDDTVAEDKIGSVQEDPLSVFEEYSTHKIASARDQIISDLYLAAHRYRGDICKLAGILDESPDLGEELSRCHSDSRVTAHIFQAAGRELTAKTGSRWIVQENPKIAALVKSLEEDLEFLGQQQRERDLLSSILAQRTGD